MNNFKRVYILFIVSILGTFSILSKSNNDPKIEQPTTIVDLPENSEVAVFAGGCFWGVEAVFESVKGVYSVKSGYSGGKKETAIYKVIGTGRTDHAEAVEIIFDPNTVSYNQLLELFFMVAHDPTQLNFQGPDRGRQYRSVIFYNSNQQKKEAENYIELLTEQEVYSRDIVTEVVKLKEFYDAEDYHQDFLWKNPTNPYIVRWDLPKLKDLNVNYPELVK